MIQKPNIDLAGLRRMTPTELRAKHLEVFGEPVRTGNKPYLIKRLAWRLQMLAEGDISERARRRAAELANDADIRVTVPRSPPVDRRLGQQVVAGKFPKSSVGGLPPPGTILTRTYKGRTIQATVLAGGFEYEGQVYSSLSAVAQAVTGSHWNGHLFFGLRKGARS